MPDPEDEIEATIQRIATRTPHRTLQRWYEEEAADNTEYADYYRRALDYQREWYS